MMIKKKKQNSFVEGAIAPEMIAQSIAAHQSRADIGGHSIFLGQIRADQIDGKLVQGMQFSSYTDLAEEAIALIREDIFLKYPLHCMHIHHSLGLVPTGGICFFVFTSSAHRKAAIEACNELVERFKKEVPVWGMELFEDGSHHWKENK